MKKQITIYKSTLFRSCLVSAVIVLLGLSWAFPQKQTASKPAAKYDASLYKGMQWREIGPFRGGRSIAVAGHPHQPYTYYFGATGGGVWKTEDGGVTWTNVSDGFFKTASVGAVAVAESDPNVIYAGMGESCIRGNISPGDGVYKSMDAGKTWKHIGLGDSQTISKIRVHPKNPDLVYVAALGHVFGRNTERGIFRSKDGGKTWEKVLYKDDKTGAVDLSIDPANARVLYAALWEAYRNPWSMSSGGPGSGLHKSTDGGDTWTELTNNAGMPKGVKGKIGVSASAAKPDRVWALIEAEEGGLFRSDDAGKTWRRINEDRRLRQRAFYYTHVVADPKSPDLIYVLNVQFLKSVDGGKSFTPIFVPHGDNHDLWIDPANPLRMIEANDGGATVSANGGQTWTREDMPTAQFYHVFVDNQFPYIVYGAQQDNSTVAIASRTTGFGIDRPDWHPVGGGESGYIVASPKDPNIVYAGNYGGLLTRYDHRTRQTQNISVWPDSPTGAGAGDLKYRFQWTYPIVASPHDPSVLYVTGNYVFKTTNDGMSWETISPDLTRNDKSKLGPSGGQITKDNTSIEYYGTVFTFVESTVQKGLLWAGSDDGLIHVRKESDRWQNVTPRDLPEWALISIIEASPHDASSAYVAATRYKLDDFKPYLYKTNDYGKTWKKITNGIPENEYTRVMREDPNRRGLLYCGTEKGIYVSFDDGANWQSLQLNLPLGPIHDLAIHPREKDLVAATHGRSFWILDDLTPLYQINDDVAKADVYLFRPRDTYRVRGISFTRPGMAVGKNPPNGVIIHYYLKNKPQGEAKLELLDEQGKLIKSVTNKAEKKEEETPRDPMEEMFSGAGQAPRVIPAEAGMNRFVWDLRYPDATAVPGALLWGGNLRGPVAVPGKYQVRLTVDGKSLTQPFELRKDPRITATPEDFKAQFELSMEIQKQLTATHEGINQIRDVRKQVDEVVKRIGEGSAKASLSQEAKKLTDKLSVIEEELIQVKVKSSQDVLNYPIKINNKLAALASVVASADTRPTQQSYAVLQELSTGAAKHLTQLKTVIDSDVPAFNRLVKEKDVPAVVLKPPPPQKD